MNVRAPVLSCALLTTFACGHSAPEARKVCTLDGCHGGIMVHLTRLPSGPFRIEMRPAAAEGTTYVYECGPTLPCRQNVFFPNMIADRVVITVVTGARSRETEIPQVVYTAYRPNGPGCEPQCQRASVTVEVPD